MTRLRYWLTAKTQYNIHSPFIFDLYNEVLFSRLNKTGEMYTHPVYKFSDHFGMKIDNSDENTTTFIPGKVFEQLLIVNHPHKNKKAEAQLQEISDSGKYNVILDLYDAAVLFLRPAMHAQRYLLK